MIIIDGYSIEQHPKQNRLIIGLPQTMNTCTSTTNAIQGRRDVLNENELATILSIAKSFYQAEGLKENI